MLHAWIKIFECFLHISYRLEFKTWQASDNENKKMLAQKKKKELHFDVNWIF